MCNSCGSKRSTVIRADEVGKDKCFEQPNEERLGGIMGGGIQILPSDQETAETIEHGY